METSKKQLQFLVFGFVMVFSISLVLILFENVQQEEFASLRAERQPVSDRIVAGAQTGASAASGGVANYREYVLTSVRLLDSILERRAAGEDVPSWEAENVYGALFAMQVPSIYQTLHLRLVRLADALRSEAVDTDAVLEQRRILSEQYPWLFATAQ